MEAAIENLAAMKAKKKVAIVGDMFELEGEAATEHARIGELLKSKNFDTVILCGSLMLSAKTKVETAIYCEQKSELIEWLKQNPINDATILVKASRGIGLETIVDYL